MERLTATRVRPPPQGADPQATVVRRRPRVAPPPDGYEGPKAQKNAVRGHSEALFHWLSPVYERFTDHALWRAQNLALTNHFPQRPLGRVLDLGCGTGVGTLAIARALPPETQVLGLDLTPEMIRRAQKHQSAEGADAARVRFVVGDAAKMLFKDASIDVAMGNSFLYLLPDPMAVLREIRRVLSPGGRLVLMEPHADGSLLKAGLEGLRHPEVWMKTPAASAWLATAMIAWRTVSGLAGRRSIEAQLALLRSAGFASVEAHPTLGGLGVHLVAERAG